MPRLIHASSLFVLLLAAARPPAAEAVPDAPADARAQSTRNLCQSRMTYANRLQQFERPVSARELPRLVVRDGLLEAAPDALNPNPVQRIKVLGSDAVWILGSTGMGVNRTTLEYIDPSAVEGDGIWNASLSVRADYLYITVRGGCKSPLEYHTISSRKNTFSLIVRAARPPGAALAGRMQTFSAESLKQFRQKFPAEYKQHVAPVVELLGLASLLKPGPADIYRVFSVLQPAPENEGQLLEIVASLASVDPAQRTAASQRLEQLGPAGVLAALRLDRSILTPEQNHRIDALIRSRSRFANDPGRLRRDPLFLIDCLETADQRVRKLALAELRTILNRDLPIDLSAGPEELGRAVAELRNQIAEQLEKASIQPIMTTQPAAPRPRVEIE